MPFKSIETLAKLSATCTEDISIGDPTFLRPSFVWPYPTHVHNILQNSWYSTLECIRGTTQSTVATTVATATLQHSF